MVDEQTLRRRRVGIVTGTTGLAIGPAFAALRGVGVPVSVSVGIIVAVAVIAILTLPKRITDALPNAFGPGRFRFVVWAIVSVIATVQTTRLSVFMADPTQRNQSVLPSSTFMTEHSCATAYFEAARVARAEPNVYDPGFNREDKKPPDAATDPSVGWRRVDGFNVDPYEYPPPFLVVPRAAIAISQSFLVHRAVWFAVDVLIAMASIVAFARLLAPEHGARFMLLAPVLLIMINVRLTLQIGNFQIAALGLSIIAMAAFARGRSALGGALLGFTIVSKLFPGLLVIYLLARRRYRDVAWTVGMGAALTALALVVFGPGVFKAFFTVHVPRLSSGEAFAFLRIPAAATINQSVFGIVIKAMHVGIPGADFALAGKVAWLYTLVAVAITAWLGRRSHEGWSANAIVVILGLGALRSPFVPQDYGPIVPQLLLLSIVAAGGQRPARVAATIVAFIVAGIGIPPDGIGPHNIVRMVLIASVPQLVGYAVIVWTLVAELRQPPATHAPALTSIPIGSRPRAQEI